MSDLIGTTEACRILDTGKTTLYRYEAAGLLEAVQYVPGGKKRWDRAQVVKLAGGVTVAPAAAKSEDQRRRDARRGLRKTA